MLNSAKARCDEYRTHDGAVLGTDDFRSGLLKRPLYWQTTESEPTAAMMKRQFDAGAANIGDR